VGNMNVTKDDTIVMDLWSNSAYMGTDDFGLPVRATKSTTDGRYHIMGDLQAAPKTVFEKIMQDASAVLDAARESKQFMVIPFPRYIQNKCCAAADHVSNFGKESFSNETYRAMEMAEQAIAACTAASGASTLSIIDTFSCADLDLAEVRTSGGDSIWLAMDPVHLSQPAYRELAAVITEGMPAAAGERPRKRARLESVVPAAMHAARGWQGRVRPPLWVSGMAPRLPTGPGRARGARGGPRGRPGSYWKPRGRGVVGGRGRPFRGRGRGYRGY